MLCRKIALFWHSKQFLYTTCSELVFSSYWTLNLINNLLPYCGLTDARMIATEKDVPAHFTNSKTANKVSSTPQNSVTAPSTKNT